MYFVGRCFGSGFGCLEKVIFMRIISGHDHPVDCVGISVNKERFQGQNLN